MEAVAMSVPTVRTVRTQTRSRSGAAGSVEIRLPWWALALPATAFVALLSLIAGPGEAGAAGGGEQPVSQVVQEIHQVLTRAMP
jgi:hypothetical protein